MVVAESSADAGADVAASDAQPEVQASAPEQKAESAPASAPAAQAQTAVAAAKPEPAPAQTGQAPEADPYASLALPEDSLLGEADLAAVKALAAEHKLSPEAAKALLTREESGRDQQLATYEDSVTGWKAKTAEVYGDKLETANAHYHAALDRFAKPGTPAAELRQVLKETGLGEYPPFFELMRAVGEAISEPGRIVNGNSQQNADASLDEAGLWRKSFPNSGPLPSSLVNSARMAT